MEHAALLDAINLLTRSWEPWLVVPPGIVVGLIFSAIPGLTTSIAMAVFLPLTLYLDFLSAILFLSAVFTGGGFGSAVPAVLMNIPGSASAVATAFDGYPMTRQGRHSEALGFALMASTIGAFLGYLLLLVVVDVIGDYVIRLGPTEMFLIAVWGLTLIASFSRGQLARGLLAGLFGVLVGTVGMSSLGQIRGTFGSMHLLDGVAPIPALIGLFAASELFVLRRAAYIVEDATLRRPSLRGILRGVADTLRYPVVVVRGSLIGIGIGSIPGVGASVANLASYSVTRQRARDPESFGKGDCRGVIASESANSSAEGGSMATLLALGIPGGAGTAVMLSAFAMHDVTGGPRFIAEHADVVYAIILANFAQVLLLWLLGLGFVFVAASIVRVPISILVPSVMAVAILGAYALTGNMAGPVTVAVFALVGWWMRRYGYSVAAAVVGILLGRMVEGEMLRSYQISGGEVAYLLGRPVTCALFLLLVVTLVYPHLARVRRRAAPPADSSAA